MRILFTLHWSFDPRIAPAIVARNLGTVFEQLGHEVHYLSLDSLPTAIPYQLRKLVFPELVAGHVRRMTANGPLDIVDASTGDAWLWARLLRRRTARPPLLVTRSHCLELLQHRARVEEAGLGRLKLRWTYPVNHGGLRLWEEATSFRQADLALFLNPWERDEALSAFGLPPERTRVVPNGLPDYLLGVPFEPHEGGSSVRIAQIGIYTRHKGTAYGAAALNRLLMRHENVSVSFLGTRRSREHVLADFDQALHGRIQVVPDYRNEELPALLRGHHVKLFPTLMEGFGVALLEAMACGLAPVASSTPGPRSIVEEGRDGLIVPPRDEQALEAAMERLVVDAELRERLRREAHATAQAYSWKRIAAHTLELYGEASEGT